MLNKEKIEEYMNNYYGFGNWNSNIWFIGMEEGGGYEEEEVNKRIESWYTTKKDLIDNKAHHERIGLTQFFEKGTLQKTWMRLIRLKLSIEGKLSGISSKDTEIIREVQKNSWGRIDSDNALLDLFPLPSPNAKDWFYNKKFNWTEIEYLKNRESYRDALETQRTQYLRDKISKHSPRVVIFYSKEYIPYWNKIVGSDFNTGSKIIFRQGKNEVRAIKRKTTCFVQVPFPGRNAQSNNFWTDTGMKIRNHLNS